MSRYAEGSDLARRLIVARALSAEHGIPLGFHHEEDQLDFDRKAMSILREIDAIAFTTLPKPEEG